MAEQKAIRAINGDKPRARTAVKEGHPGNVDQLSIQIDSAVMQMVRQEKADTKRSFRAILEERLSESYERIPRLARLA